MLSEGRKKVDPGFPSSYIKFIEYINSNKIYEDPLRQLLTMMNDDIYDAEQLVKNDNKFDTNKKSKIHKIFLNSLLLPHHDVAHFLAYKETITKFYEVAFKYIAFIKRNPTIKKHRLPTKQLATELLLPEIKALAAFCEPYINGTKMLKIHIGNILRLIGPTPEQKQFLELEYTSNIALHKYAVNIAETRALSIEQKTKIDALLKKINSSRKYGAEPNVLREVIDNYIQWNSIIYNIEQNSADIGDKRAKPVNGIFIHNYSKDITALERWQVVIKQTEEAWDKVFGSYFKAQDVFQISIRISDKNLTRGAAAEYHVPTISTATEKIEPYIIVPAKPRSQQRMIWDLIHELAHHLWDQMSADNKTRAQEVYSIIKKWDSFRPDVAFFADPANEHKAALWLFLRFPTDYARRKNAEEFFSEFIACCVYYLGISGTKDPTYLGIDYVSNIYSLLAKYILGGNKATIAIADTFKSTKAYQEFKKNYSDAQQNQTTEAFIKKYVIERAEFALQGFRPLAHPTT